MSIVSISPIGDYRTVSGRARWLYRVVIEGEGLTYIEMLRFEHMPSCSEMDVAIKGTLRSLGRGLDYSADWMPA
ncbi:MAG: hypothetical protein JSS20_08225 [Proteobacteria bacterium]|nr:hypothetical protein [Pseudomonadota bacterium]